MADTERRTMKPLKKQPEIEEVEEDEPETNGSPNSDVSDATVTPGIDTPVAQSTTDSPEGETVESGRQSPPMDSSVSVQQQVDTYPPPPEQHPPPLRASHSQNKMKTLQRAEALCEDMSPPPEIIYSSDDQQNSTLKVDSYQLEKSGSQSSDAGTSGSLSRESSFDTQYKDSTGVDLEEFIKKTLNKSVKDRKMILQLARDLKKFIKEPKHQFLQFAEMSSYDRMLVHRISAFFGLDHNVDQSGKAVIASKTKITRIPDFSFEEHIAKGGEIGGKKKILPRKVPSLDERESKGLEKHMLGFNRAKSLEERQKSYDEARTRIFKNGEGSAEDYLGCAPLVSLVGSKEDLGSRQPSTDSSGYGSSENTGKLPRLNIQKANSYGGLPATSGMKYQGSTLSKADSIGSGHSFDCGSGRPYPVPTSPPGSHSDQSPMSRSSSAGPVPSPHGTGLNSQYAFLVAMDPNSIPPGSMILNPQTLQPHMNPDGTLYRYDPAAPPPWLSGAMPAAHPSAPSSASFPNNLQTQYSNEHDLANRVSNFSISQSPDIIESQQQQQQQQPAGVATQSPTPHGPHYMMNTHQPYPSQPPYIQQTYFPGAQGVTGQPVRYTYQVPYHMQGQGSVDGQSHASGMAHIGQFSQQPYVQGYPTTNYPNVVVQPSVSQSADMTVSNTVTQTGGVYTGAPQPEGGVPTYSIQYGPYSHPPQQQQGSYGQQAQSSVYYSVSGSNPQLGYSFPGPSGPAMRPTTPPSQGNLPNPNLAINMSQPVNFQQPISGGGSGGGTQYGTYPVYPQLHQQATVGNVRPVNQVVQIPGGVQSSAGPSPQQSYSIVRPSMQVPQSAGMGFKGYSVNTCYQKQGMMITGENNKEATGTTPTGLPGHVTSGIRQQQIGTGDLRMMGPSFRPQVQPVQYGQRASSQPGTPLQQTPNKTRD